MNLFNPIRIAFASILGKAFIFDLCFKYLLLGNYHKTQQFNTFILHVVLWLRNFGRAALGRLFTWLHVGGQV